MFQIWNGIMHKETIMNNKSNYNELLITKKDFGKSFTWGVSASAFQTEGAWDTDDKGMSVWDVFTRNNRKVKDYHKAKVATDFYNQYKNDIALIRNMNFSAFRFSVSWPRIIPGGTGKPSPKGISFYHRIIDSCLKNGIEPWLTLYHWDLPQVLEEKGGWSNREITGWFESYTDICTRAFGDKIKNWIILNEPMSFTGLGYFSGYHAPGRKGFRNFLPAAHHAALCQSNGGRIVRQNVKDSYIGTTFSMADISPVNQEEKNIGAARRLDAVFNRFFIEPALGLGYPLDALPSLKKIEKYMKQDDDKNLVFDFDFIGIQYFFRIVTAFSFLPPILFAKEIPAIKRNVETNAMGMEVYQKGLYHVLKKIQDYNQIKTIVITESGICYQDKLENGRVHDHQRLKYLQDTLRYTLKAMKEGVNISGYFVWSLTDNFEWKEGLKPRFGLVYVDYQNLKRVIKDSGLWFREFLEK